MFNHPVSDLKSSQSITIHHQNVVWELNYWKGTFPQKNVKEKYQQLLVLAHVISWFGKGNIRSRNDKFRQGTIRMTFEINCLNHSFWERWRDCGRLELIVCILPLYYIMLISFISSENEVLLGYIFRVNYNLLLSPWK